jgi:hypothetical protein
LSATLIKGRKARVERYKPAAARTPTARTKGKR